MHSDDRPGANVVINATLVGELIRSQFPQWGDLPLKPVEFDGWDKRLSLALFHLPMDRRGERNH